MVKKYTLDISRFFFVWFGPLFGAFLILAIYLTIIMFQTVFLFIHSNKMYQNQLFNLALITLGPLWYFIHIALREFRFPVIWLSDAGITALAITIIPVKVHVSWENVLDVVNKKTLDGTLFGYGTSILVKPLGKTQRRIFGLLGKDEIFISSKMSKYDELVGLITKNIQEFNLS